MEKTQDTLDYDGKAPGDLPRTAAKETREREPAQQANQVRSGAVHVATCWPTVTDREIV